MGVKHGEHKNQILILGFRSAPIKEICDEIARELIDKKDPETLSPLKGPYLGQKPPGVTPELFAPGIISTCLHDDYGLVISKDGKETFYRIFGKLYPIICVIQCVDEK